MEKLYDMEKKSMKCKRCNNERIVKNGKKILSGRIVQRFQCVNCGYIFNEE